MIASGLLAATSDFVAVVRSLMKLSASFDEIGSPGAPDPTTLSTGIADAHGMLVCGGARSAVGIVGVIVCLFGFVRSRKSPLTG